MKGYIPIEYPKWVDGVLVQNAAEEQAYRATTDEAAAAASAVELTRAPSPAGIRMRRTRERRREGKLSIRCELSTIQIEALAKAGFIDPVMLDDAAEVARGVCRSLDRLTLSAGTLAGDAEVVTFISDRSAECPHRPEDAGPSL
jgi:hypothetical protein